MAEPLLDVKDLTVHFPTEDGVVKAVDGISFTIQPGETLGIVGESGSGKSVSFLTIMGLITSNQATITGQVLYRGQDMLAMPLDELRTIRGASMSMIFQDPMTSLHPFYKVGDQISEAIRVHQPVSKRTASSRRWRCSAASASHGRRSGPQFPHEFSGGMRQRAMIAMALSLNPDLLIADEPTTALDVTVQAQILDLIDRLKEEFNAAVAIITHDLGVVAEHCDNIQVMYAGKIVEPGTATTSTTRRTTRTRGDCCGRSRSRPHVYGWCGVVVDVVACCRTPRSCRRTSPGCCRSVRRPRRGRA